MTKQRALGIIATVTQKAYDTDDGLVFGTTITHTGYFYIESLIGDILGQLIPSFAVYGIYSVNGTFDKPTAIAIKTLSTAGSEPATFLQSVRDGVKTPSAAPAKLTYLKTQATGHDNVEVFNLDESICVATGSSTSSMPCFSSVLAAGPVANNTNMPNRIINAWIRYLVCMLTDEEYDALVKVWIDRIQKTMKADFPDLEGEVVLSFDNAAVKGATTNND